MPCKSTRNEDPKAGGIENRDQSSAYAFFGKSTSWSEKAVCSIEIIDSWCHFTVNRKQCIKEELAYHTAAIAEHRARLAELGAELAAINEKQ
eukprot:scaffold3693_cov187-Skeletonema_marinoi.AAC.2